MILIRKKACSSRVGCLRCHPRLIRNTVQLLRSLAWKRSCRYRTASRFIGRPQNFFVSTSCSISLSRLRSTTSFFSLASLLQAAVAASSRSAAFRRTCFFSGNTSALRSRVSGTPPRSGCPIRLASTQRRSAPLCNYSSSFRPPFSFLQFIIFSLFRWTTFYGSRSNIMQPLVSIQSVFLIRFAYLLITESMMLSQEVQSVFLAAIPTCFAMSG